MSAFDTNPENPVGDSSTLRSQQVWKSAGQQDLDFESQRLRNRLRAKMFGVDAAPVKIGRFTVLETVGSGGMGVVYGAYDQQLDRRVAVKLLRTSREEDASIGRERMLREAQALAKLSHPNVVQVYEVGTFNDRVFLAMEFLPGPNLREWMLDGPRPWRDVLGHLVDAGRGLAAAHQQGVIHRDFKPANLLFGGDGHLRVVDFGLARATEPVSEELFPPSSEGGPRAFAIELTQTGEIMGTPAYMSPEQARQESIDARSDQYSFCVALYEALFGLRPHVGRSTSEVLVAVAEGEVRTPPRNLGVPTRIVRAIMRGLSAAPAQRFPSMEALLAELALEDRRRWGLVGAGVLLVGVLGVLGANGEAPCPSFDDALEDTWGSDRRAAVEAAFDASGVLGAASALTLTSERLDEYAEDWLVARRDTCDAHHVRREQSAQLHDERVVCLAERHAEFATLTQALASADGDVVNEAARAAAELTSISECGDLERLQRRGQIDPVRQDLRLRLAQAQAQYKIGQYEPALAALGALEREARDHGAPELEAAGLFHQGLIHQRRRVHPQANDAFAGAVDLAEEGGDDELSARAWVYLAQGQAVLGEIDEAKRSIRHASAKATRLGDERLAEEVRESQVVAAWQANHFDEAIRGQRLVVDWERESFGEQHPRTADAEHRLANILSSAGQHADAQLRYAQAIDVLERSLGPESPEVARVWFDMGIDYRAAGHMTQALSAFEGAERRFVAALGIDAPELLDINKALATLAQQRGDLDEADRRIDKLVELSRRDGLPAQEQLDILSLQAMVASQRGAHAEAIGICRAYFDHVEDTPTDPDVEVQALFMRGVLVTELGYAGRHEEAEPAARRLIEDLAAQPLESGVAGLLGHAWLVIGRSAEARGEPEPAAKAYSSGLERLQGADFTDPGMLAVQARLRWGLARVLGPSDGAAAVPQAVEARDALARAEPAAVELDQIDAWLRTHD